MLLEERLNLKTLRFYLESEINDILEWEKYIKDKVEPEWKIEVDAKEEKLVKNLLTNKAHWVKENKIINLQYQLKEINQTIKWYTNKIIKYFSRGYWFDEVAIEFIHKNYLKPLFKEEKKLTYKIYRWKYPRKKNKEITNEDIEEAKKVSIEKFLGKPYQGGYQKVFYKAPWREEKIASLCVYKKTNSWYDFGEGVGGDNIDLIMRLYNISFLEAIKFLLNKP